ncbi:NADAR family protein [Spirillospora sp. NBC_00431]
MLVEARPSARGVLFRLGLRGTLRVRVRGRPFGPLDDLGATRVRQGIAHRYRCPPVRADRNKRNVPDDRPGSAKWSRPQARRADDTRPNAPARSPIPDRNPLAKDLGRRVRGFDEQTWQDNRLAIVTKGNEAKFAQNEELLDYLLGTRNRVLVEAGPLDRVWGIGLAADDPRAEQPSAWKGQNLLRFALMAARTSLGA